MTNIEDMEATIRKLQAEDGDIIVVTSERHLQAEQVRLITKHMSLIIDDIGVRAKVLVLDGGLGIQVIKTSQLQPIGEYRVAA